jgi:hypothetical protein
MIYKLLGGKIILDNTLKEPWEQYLRISNLCHVIKLVCGWQAILGRALSKQVRACHKSSTKQICSIMNVPIIVEIWISSSAGLNSHINNRQGSHSMMRNRHIKAKSYINLKPILNDNWTRIFLRKPNRYLFV